MEHHQKPSSTPPHVLFLPLPIQGPVNCMLKLAQLFCFHHLQVTFLNTDYIQHRLLNCTDISSRFNRYSKSFRFETVPDGLPEDNPRTIEQLGELVDSMDAVSLPLFKDIVRSCLDDQNPLTCIIADGAFTFAVDVAKEFGIPLLYFDTMSPCAIWSIICADKFIQSGQVPFEDNDMDAPVTNVPGIEGFLRRRDLPSFFRVSDKNTISPRVLSYEQLMRQSQGMIFNSFEDLEGPILSQMKTITPKVYAIGPLHTHTSTRLIAPEEASKDILNSSNSIWKENKDCVSWLDEQPAKSVIYVSIGSLAIMGKEQFLEIWHGLVNSGVKFLWVQRPGSIRGLDEQIEISRELCQATKERGCVVSWAPQEEVLAHPAVGGFLTHSGWNSTLESIVEGVPMICWPYFADQQMNSRYVGEGWKVGLDMKDTCDRGIVEGMIRDLMVVRKDEFLKNVDHMAKLAKASVNKGGSSYNGLNRLIEDIKLMSLQASLRK